MVAAALWAILTAVIPFTETVQENIELAKQLWDFLKLFPVWLTYHKQLGEKLKTLKRKQDVLNCREHDFIKTLEREELQPGKRRRKETEMWMRNVETKKRDVRDLESKAGETRYLKGLLLENAIERSLREVEELLACEFPNGLTLDVRPTKEPLLTQTLVGQDSNLETIMKWLNDPSVSRIGVYGVKGVGKTAILTHIQSRLSQSSSTTFEHVYWVRVSEKNSVHKLQDAIAKQVGLDLSGVEDKMIRAAKLHGLLTKKGKCLIMLDGVGKAFNFTEDIGIPNNKNGCKLILSTLPLKYCRMMDCDRTLEIKPLSNDGAVKLFWGKLSPRDPFGLGAEINEIVKLIVSECQGLPILLVNVAERLRQVDDIVEWRDALTELTEFKRGHAD